MTKIFNISSIPEKFMDDSAFTSPLTTQYLGALAGSEKLYINIDRLKPGAKSAKYHSHSLNEEFFLILKGTGKLRIKDEIKSVEQGDFFSKPAGRGIAHQFINDSDEILEILDIGINDINDVVEYPDEEITLVQGKAYKHSQAVKTWSSDPNR